MLFCQLGGAKSLREICGGLAASEGKLRHLGLPQAPARSTLAYANEHRPWQFTKSYSALLTQCRGLAVQQSAGRRKFRFKHKLISLDADGDRSVRQRFRLGAIPPHQRPVKLICCWITTVSPAMR